jgi:hypothetical protein
MRRSPRKDSCLDQLKPNRRLRTVSLSTHQLCTMSTESVERRSEAYKDDEVYLLCLFRRAGTPFIFPATCCGLLYVGSGQSGHRRRNHECHHLSPVYLWYSTVDIRHQPWIREAPHVDALLDERRCQGGGVAGAVGTMIESKVPRLISATKATGPLDSASLNAIRSVDV